MASSHNMQDVSGYIAKPVPSPPIARRNTSGAGGGSLAQRARAAGTPLHKLGGK